MVAVGWQTYELTGSALALGLVGLVQFAPSLALLFAAGPLVDRLDRRRIVATTRSIEGTIALALAAASAAGALTAPMIYGFVLVLGVLRAFDQPAGQALVPSLVPATLLARAVALVSSASQAATIAGPALGGLLYVMGPTACYGASGALSLAAAATIARIPVRPAPLERPPLTPAYLFAGISFIRGRPVLLGAISLDLFAVLLGGATALLPIYARDVLHTGPWGLGLLRSSAAVGALGMALWLARHPLQRRVGARMLQAVAVFGVATVVFGLSRSVALSAIALAVGGAADMVSVVVRQSLIQLETPDAMRGRVGSVASVFIGASNQIGEFESGALAALVGAVPAVVAGGVGTLLVVALWWRRFPALARRDRMVEPAARPPG